MLKIAKEIKLKTHYSLKAYAEINGLSLSSLYRGYISKETAKKLKEDNIFVKPNIKGNK